MSQIELEMDATGQVKVVAATLGMMKGIAEIWKRKIEVLTVAIDASQVNIKPKFETILEKLECTEEKRICKKVMKNEVDI